MATKIKVESEINFQEYTKQKFFWSKYTQLFSSLTNLEMKLDWMAISIFYKPKNKVEKNKGKKLAEIKRARKSVEKR